VSRVTPQPVSQERKAHPAWQELAAQSESSANKDQSV